MNPEHNHELDARGLLCPEPIMMLHNSIRDMAEGEIVLVLATDPSTQRDIPKFCTFLGHELVASSADEELFQYWIAKKSA